MVGPVGHPSSDFVWAVRNVGLGLKVQLLARGEGLRVVIFTEVKSATKTLLELPGDRGPRAVIQGHLCLGIRKRWWGRGLKIILMKPAKAFQG